MYKISEHSVLYIISLFTAPSLMSMGKGCYKGRSSSLPHMHMRTSTLTHTRMDVHTHGCSGLYAAVSNQSLIQRAQRGGSQPRFWGL